jgi:hypothetical protein
MAVLLLSYYNGGVQSQYSQNVLFIVALTNYAAVFTPFMTMLDYF